MTKIIKDKIIIYNNKKNEKTCGTNFHISIKSFTGISNETISGDSIYNITNFFNENDNTYNENLDNKIILSTNIFNYKVDDDRIFNCSLVTQQQLFNNIKFIFKKNDFTKPRLVFFNNKNIKINKNKYLFESRNAESEPEGNKFIFIKDNIKISTANSFESDSDFLSLQPLLHSGFNFYKQYENSDYYKIKFKDFIYNNNNETFNNYKINSIEISNNFLNNNLINYDINNFKTLFYNTDLCSNVFPLNTSETNEISNNIFIYNQINNTTIIDICLNDYTDINNKDLSNNNIKINFGIIKRNNINSKYFGKILINNEYININGYVLGENTNFFDSEKNNHEKFHYNYGNENKLYLSLGNGLTGLTQKNIMESINFEKNTNTNNKTKIFGNKITFKNKNITLEPNSDFSNNYLLDNSYNYDFTNTLYFQENIPTDPETELPIKKFELNLRDYFNNRDFSSSFNNLELLNNELSNNYYNESYNNNNIYFQVDNSSNDIKLFEDNFTTTHKQFNLKIDISTSSPNYKNYNNIYEFRESSDKITDKLCYDFRYNYEKKAYLVLYFDLKYILSPDSNEIFSTTLNDFSNNLLLNFNKFVITNYFETTTGSDFTNVDCIFIYHDPDDPSTDRKFKYPRNNIEIKKDVAIDTLSKAIELLPNARTGTSNSVFLPAKNGSNLSRKMIQGYIGMNNIPKLLSIEPYDQNVINNRGFNNQLNFYGGSLSAVQLKLSPEDRVALKYESQKHNSQKNVVVTSRKNFANLVKQPARSRNVNFTQNVQNCPDPINNITPNQYKTPFKLFRTGRGSYLNSGK